MERPNKALKFWTLMETQYVTLHRVFNAFLPQLQVETIKKKVSQFLQWINIKLS